MTEPTFTNTTRPIGFGAYMQKVHEQEECLLMEDQLVTMAFETNYLIGQPTNYGEVTTILVRGQFLMALTYCSNLVEG